MKRARARPSASPRRPEAAPASISPAVLAWYDAHRRDLPWRRTKDPYAIWVSEMMLQQTQVATVIDYYERWMRRFPTVAALARSEESDVLHAWQGLGYYSRARNLWRGARAVVDEHGGRVPRGVEELRALPGIGPYSAGAIASIAHGERTPLVDGNVIRVLSRLFELRGDPARAPLKGELWRIADSLVPENRPGDFNQALMELGARVCTPREPTCGACPLSAACQARANGTARDLPELKKRVRTVVVPRAAAVVFHRGRVLCVQVPEGARRWAGMWQFPNADVATGEAPETAARRAVCEASGLDVSVRGPSVTVRHSVTHHRITLDVFEGDAPGGTLRDTPRTRWVTPAALDELALPSAHRRIARFVQARRA